MLNAKKVVPAGNNLEISGLAGDDQGNSDNDKVVDHKRNRPLLNILKLNPLDLDAKKETKDPTAPAASIGSAPPSAM